MTAIPIVWLWVSGIAFALSALLNIGLIVGGIVVWKKIGPVIDQANTQIKSIGEKGNEIADKAKGTVEIVHDRATSILGSAEEASGRVTARIGAASAALTGIFVMLRIAAFARGMAQSHNKTEVKLKRIKA